MEIQIQYVYVLKRSVWCICVVLGEMAEVKSLKLYVSLNECDEHTVVVFKKETNYMVKCVEIRVSVTDEYTKS